MSRLTTSALKTAAPAADSTSVTPGLPAWADGDWVEFIPVTSAVNTTVAGVCFQDDSAWSGVQLEVGIGTGLGGVEIEIGHIRLSLPASGNGGPTQYLLPYPVSGIQIGSRVSLRYRSNDSAGPDTWPVTLLYYEDLDSDEHVSHLTATLTSFPAGADSVSLTPSATPWDDSDWTEVDPNVGEDASIFGAALSNPEPGNVDAELDIGIGAIGAETVLTTIRFGAWDLNSSRINFVSLPGLLPLATASRLVARLRKGGSDTNTLAVAFLGYRGPIGPPGDEGDGVIGPLLWIEWPDRPETV